MFGRSRGSKNSATGGGGSALTSHLFHRRLLPKPTTSAAARSADNPRKTTDVPTTATATTRQDDRSPVQLVSVRRNTEESTRGSSTEGSTESRGRRRGKLGLSLAVVRGPSTMSDSGSSVTSSLSDVVQDPPRDNEHHNSAAGDTSTSLAPSHAAIDVQRSRETAGE